MMHGTKSVPLWKSIEHLNTDAQTIVVVLRDVDVDDLTERTCRRTRSCYLLRRCWSAKSVPG